MRSLSIWSMTALFAAAIVAAWAWFYVGVTPPEKSYVFRTRAEIPGYKFTATPVGEMAQQILATTNLVNGQFEGANRERYMVFAADWTSKGKQMSVIGHTPEVCWVGSGFQLTTLGEPPFMEVPLGDERITLECRVFRTPDGRSLEMVVWGSLVSGQPLEEGFRFQPDRSRDEGSVANMNRNSRTRSLNSFVRSIVYRQPGDGTKQFVRFSTAVTGDWKESFRRLETFAPRWLDLEVQRSRAVAVN